MAWLYAYKLSATSPASSGTPVLDFFDMFRIPREEGPEKRGGNLLYPFQDGEPNVERNKFYGAQDLITEGDLRYTDSTGAITHGNLAAGHVFENLNLWRELVGGKGTTLWLGRNEPDAGVVEVPVEVIGKPIPLNPRWRYQTVFRKLDPFWRDETQRTGLGTSFTLAGTALVSDALVTVTAGTDVRVTHDQSGDYLEIEGATPAGGVLFTCGPVRSITKVTGGAAYDQAAFPSSGRWFRLYPGSVTFTVTGGGSLSIDLYEKWL